jgi:L-threonylcarbamoyladenylate synthase
MRRNPVWIAAGPGGADDGSLAPAVDVLRSGGVLAFPTETVYGLGCDAENPEAVRRVAALKGRPDDKAFILLVPSAGAVRSRVAAVGAAAARLMTAFWPGPLTLVFRVSGEWSPASGGDTVAFRVSPDPVCRSLGRLFPRPIVSTSANPAGLEPARSAQEVGCLFPKGLDAVIDGGERRSALPSTVVDVTGAVPRLIRRGPVSADALRSVAGSLDES